MTRGNGHPDHRDAGRQGGGGERASVTEGQGFPARQSKPWHLELVSRWKGQTPRKHPGSWVGVRVGRESGKHGGEWGAELAHTHHTHPRTRHTHAMLARATRPPTRLPT